MSEMNHKLKETGRSLFKAFNTGISYFLPVIIAGGMLFSFTLFTGHIENGAIIPSNQFWQNVYSLGIAGFSMMVPVICGYIAYAIAGKPALAPGLIMGYVANNPIGEDQLSTGFIGALLLGFIVGYFVKWMKTWKVIDSLKPMMPTFFIPLLTTFVVGIFYIYVLTGPINAFVQIIVDVMNGLSGTNAILLGLGIGLLAAADFGGPCSKAATAFTLALMSLCILAILRWYHRRCLAICGQGLQAYLDCMCNRYSNRWCIRYGTWCIFRCGIWWYCCDYWCHRRTSLVCCGYVNWCADHCSYLTSHKDTINS